jgi:hypothetical protein
MGNIRTEKKLLDKILVRYHYEHTMRFKITFK